MQPPKITLRYRSAAKRLSLANSFNKPRHLTQEALEREMQAYSLVPPVLVRSAFA